MKIVLRLFTLFFFFLLFSCKKDKDKTSCELGMCDKQRKTIDIATNWTGTLGYYNDIRKWAVNVAVLNTIDSIRTCIICTDIPDSLKTIGKFVTFSGELKESCSDPKPELHGQGIFFITPTNIK